MSNLIPFDSSNLPAYLRGKPQVNNEDLLAHASNGYPIISIKGKVFTVSRDGEKTVLPNPRDPDSPASNIDMVLVKVNKGTSKVWYAKGYVEGSDAKPDCFSNDGLRPDTSVEKPQAKSCAACAKNAWGSKIGDGGTASKGKACSDSVRMAVATPDLINDPYFVRVPAASIRNLGEYGKMLAKRGVSYQMVVTKIAFDQASPTPTLTFKPVGFLPEDAYKAVLEEAAGDTVQSILGSGAAESAPAVQEDDIPRETYKAPTETPKPAPQPKPTPTVDVDEVQQAVAAAAPEPKPQPKPAPAVAETTNLADIDLDSLDFDA